MPASETTFRNLNRLHVWFALSALALLGATLWMVAANYSQPWRAYQQTYHAQIDPAAPAVPTIKQIWLPELKLDYHFQKVARFDRCTTCHLGLDRGDPKQSAEAASRGEPAQPFRPHPRLDLFVAAGSPHPAEQFGCTICHDGQGSATDFTLASHTPNDLGQRARWWQEYGWRRHGSWDEPMLPARFAESHCLKCHHEVVDLEPSGRFRDPPAAKLLAGYQLVRDYGCFGCHEINGFGIDGRRVGPDMQVDGRRPGSPRKPGPRLRDASERMNAAVLADRIGEPAHYLPNGRMPKLFGQFEHLSGPTLSRARRLEAVELRAVVSYLQQQSPAAESPAFPANVAASADRGKRLFAEKGCLACHGHDDFPTVQAPQGPDLSRAGLKYTGPRARQWLVAWLRDPLRLSPRTLMPQPQLEPLAFSTPHASEGADAPTSDPAVDLAEYLLASGTPKAAEAASWEPAALPEVSDADLDELALMDLGQQVSADEARRYLAEGVPASQSQTALPDAARWLTAPITRKKKLGYVGARTIGKRGCYSCHDIAGFDNAAPIGPALADWGRKPESLLAFEKIDRLPSSPDDDPFYRDALQHHRREGFAWQKLRAPRSFDYEVAAQRPFNEWLRMGQFRFTPQQREQIITFLLALVADPPPERYVAHGDARRQAIVAGRRVLEKYACAQCHTLALERWTFDYDPAKWPTPPPVAEYDFLRPQASPAQLVASAGDCPDFRATKMGLSPFSAHGHSRAEVVGMPRVDVSGKPVEDEDDDGNAICFFSLWEPAVLAGHVWPAGGREVIIPKASIVGIQPPDGGGFARWLYPRALGEARAAGATAAELEAWGWVPPPLVGEGAKVEPAWLYDYLLNPRAIRPAAVLRMPRFNLSAEEATALVGYFAAVADAEYPYATRPPDPLAGVHDRPRRLADARRILTDHTTYCAKCHLIGDSRPGGESRTILAPNLADAGQRLRPEYLRRWLANPKSVLPYTAMPVNFPPGGPPLGQDLFPGTSREQLDAVMDLLLHYVDVMCRPAPAQALTPK